LLCPSESVTEAGLRDILYALGGLFRFFFFFFLCDQQSP